MGKFIDITEERFGKLVVTALWGFRHSMSRDKYGRIRKSRKSLWTVRCDCGVVKEKVFGNNLRTGKTRSCGCSHHAFSDPQFGQRMKVLQTGKPKTKVHRKRIAIAAKKFWKLKKESASCSD